MLEVVESERPGSFVNSGLHNKHSLDISNTNESISTSYEFFRNGLCLRIDISAAAVAAFPFAEGSQDAAGALRNPQVGCCNRSKLRCAEW